MTIEVVTNTADEAVEKVKTSYPPDNDHDACCKMNIIVIAKEVEIEQECKCED